MAQHNESDVAVKTKKNLFDHLYDGAQEVLKGMQKPFVERSLKRKFEAAYDQTLLKVDEAHSKLNDLRQNIKEFPLDKILEQRQIIKDAESLQKDIEDEYLAVFGSTITKR